MRQEAQQINNNSGATLAGFWKVGSRLLIMFLAVSVAASHLASCRKPEARQGNESEILGILLRVEEHPDDRLEISWLGVPRQIRGREGSWIERNLERRFNVELKPIFIEWMGYKRRKPLMMLGGDIPDVYWVESALDMRRDVHHGFVLELPYEVLLKHAPSYVEAINEYAPEAWLLSYYEGRNYGIPTFGALENSVYPQTGIWRIDWLERVGITKVPETLDEMFEALWRFRHEDPDRNGRMDTYGMSPKAGLSQNVRVDHSFGEIYGAFGILSAGWMEREGRLVWGGVLPETRAVLAELRRWYEKGLIYPDYLLIGDNRNERFYRFTRGEVGYLPDYGRFDSYNPRFGGSLAGLMSRLHPEAVYFPPGPFPKGPTGLRGAPVTGGSENIMLFGRHLIDQPEKVIRVLRMFNEMAADVNVFLEAKIGKRGTHWEFTEREGIIGLPPFDEPFYGSPELVGMNPTISHAFSFFCPFGARKAWLEIYHSEAEKNFDRAFRNEGAGIKSPIPWPDTVPAAERYYADLRILQETVFSEIIQGDSSLEAFDEFVEEWYSRGGRELTRDANRMLRIKRRIFKAVGAREL